MTAFCSSAVITRRPRFERAVAVPPGARTTQGLGDGRPEARVRAPSRGFFRYFREPINAPLQAARVIGAGYAEVNSGEAYPPRNHPKLYSYEWRAGRVLPEHQVVLLSNAAGEFESRETGRVRLLGEALLFLFPGVWHRYRPLAGGGWTERWVALHGDAFATQLARAGLSPASAVASPTQSGRMRHSFDSLLNSAEASVGASNHTNALALQVFEEAVRQSTDAQLYGETPMADECPEVDDAIVQAALEIIWNHPHCPPLGVNDVAKQLPITRRTLDRRFAEALGRTVLDEINACRISRAKRLLAETDMPIKAVAYRAGFPSRERLRLAFLSHTGMPPSEFREHARQSGAVTNSGEPGCPETGPR